MRTFRTLPPLLLATSLVLPSGLAVLAASESGTSEAKQPATGPDWVIHGRVTDSATKLPISQAKVFTDAVHYTYTASDGTYALNTDKAIPAKVFRNMDGVARKLMALSAGTTASNSPSVREAEARFARNAGGPAARKVKYEKLGYYYTITNMVTDSQRVVDVQMSSSPPCTTMEMHPFLYAGEFQNQGGDYFDNQKVYLVVDGKIVWTYSATKASVGGKLIELGDLSVKSNGNIVMSLGWGGAREIIPDYGEPAASKIIWSCPSDEQIHTAQPVGGDKVFVIDNSKKPKAKLFDQTTGSARAWDLPAVGTDAHGMFRHCRMTKAGTLLIAHMNMAKVVEYDSETMKPLWVCSNMPNAWAAVRLKNGNTLVSGNENKYVREVNPQGKIVWKFDNDDLPAGSGINLGNVQECDRLANGNTVICTWQGSPSVLEVTPEKRIVWMLPKNLLGNSSSIQLLDEPGAMEDGGLQR